MAANYWNSTQQRFWTFTKPELEAKRRQLEISEGALWQQYPLPNRRLLDIYINQRKPLYSNLFFMY